MNKPKWITVIADRLRLRHFTWGLSDSLYAAAGGAIGAAIGFFLTVAWIR